MKPNFSRLLVVSVIGLFLAVSMFAQDRRGTSPISNLYVISAKAGAVNYVSGNVSVEQDAAKKATLKKGDEVEAGNVISTDADGRVEILLNPGSYVRLAENSAFEFVTTSLDEDLELKLHRGSAIFEVIADKNFKIIINTPNARFYLIQSGVYRVDALEDGSGKISVWKGKAQVGDAKATTVKGGKAATFGKMQTTVAKFDRDIKGEFDLWSKERAQTIAKLNEKLMQRQMRQSLLNSFNNNVWSASSGYGLWVQDPFSRSYCFLPFGWGWRSPYGFGYNQSIWNYNPPPQITYTMNQNNVINNPGSSQGMNPPPSSNGNVPSINPGNSGGSPMPQNNPPTRQDNPPPVREAPGRPDQVQRPVVDN